jgi:hypothetical protein
MASASEHTVALLAEVSSPSSVSLVALSLSLSSARARSPAQNFNSWSSILLGQVQEEYTTDGSLDFHGNPALKHRTGGWRACRSVLGEFPFFFFFFPLRWISARSNFIVIFTRKKGKTIVIFTCSW